MARAAADGHRVVVVYATNGDHGSAPDDLGGLTVAQYRRGEAEASARVLGTARVTWLDYADSGMSGWEQNGADGAFSTADLDEAAARLAAILDEEDADVLVGYDWHGNYGHPDHVAVHRVTQRALELAARRPEVFEVTMNRDEMRRARDAALAAGITAEEYGLDPDAPADDGNPFGTPEAEIHWRVDVSAYLAQKRAAMECHQSQVDDIGWFLRMPPEQFAAAFGIEYFIEPGRAPGMVDGWPF